MKTKKDTRTAEEKKKALKAALHEAGLDVWSPGSPMPDSASGAEEPAGGSKAREGSRPPDGGET
ncbi:MAG TPA: hypothetical protein VH394_27370 [Thermoanaerobaculia bacterium]|jgi:hypothetical protein|nr:hypothetical protein [Thermoanaerobaculia bacterium]